jgi:hypothetical protein
MVTEVPMKVCAWCRRPMRADHLPESFAVQRYAGDGYSDGLCVLCLETYFPEQVDAVIAMSRCKG